MATRTIHKLVDDLDGGAADETVSFGFQGTEYEIDLSTTNAQVLRKAVSDYVEHARKVRGKGRATAFNQVDTAAVRAWAQSHHLKVNARGRISADVLAKYREAGN